MLRSAGHSAFAEALSLNTILLAPNYTQAVLLHEKLARTNRLVLRARLPPCRIGVVGDLI